MAGKIKVLDEKVISQIAAGEVIERPASVVKELVENSIDADASQVIVEIVDGGKKSIKVADDGIGMAKEDLEKAFFRHSTSKITTLRDLESIDSLGFRGEALASIAAVSKVTLTSKPRDSEVDAGSEVFVEGGKIRYVKDAARNVGTTVVVDDLFYNTPARRKYMKSVRAEISKITDVITRQALIYPEIFFKLVHNSQEILNTPRSHTPLDNIVHIYGKEMAKEMLPVSYSDHELEIEGFISKPAVTRKSASHISIFVNKRYVTSKGLASAIKSGYHNLIMKNSYPIAVISMKIHPRKIDVNVHPTKQEIRFEDEKKVHNAVMKAVEESLRTESLIPEVGDVKLEIPEIAVFAIPQISGSDILRAAPIIDLGKQISIENFDIGVESKVEVEPPKEKLDDHLPKMTLIGQILNTYIVAQSKENLLIIDQHAAHERVRFENLLKNNLGDKKESQELLSPVTIDVTPKQGNFVAENIDIFEGLGFQLVPFGRNTYQIRAVPVVMEEMASEKTFHDIIDDLMSAGKSSHKEELVEKAMAIVACHSAIRGGDELSSEQMKSLVESLYRTENAYACPHGRPTILSISKDEIEKRFKRK
jgi:DNA mismatch repair protein MutL